MRIGQRAMRAGRLARVEAVSHRFRADSRHHCPTSRARTRLSRVAPDFNPPPHYGSIGLAEPWRGLLAHSTRRSKRSGAAGGVLSLRGMRFSKGTPLSSPAPSGSGLMGTARGREKKSENEREKDPNGRGLHPRTPAVAHPPFRRRRRSGAGGGASSYCWRTVAIWHSAFR
jgi:hypothetical protein